GSGGGPINEAPCTEGGGKVDPTTGHCYFVLRGQMNSRMTWTDARNRCASLNGAHLATITSEEEQAFVESFATTGPGGTGDLWIGLWREGAATATNKFAWITDEPVNYVNW